MEPQLVILTAVEPGVGKTYVCQELVAWLRGHGRKVGGFSIVRAYDATNLATPTAFYAHLYATDERLRLSHAELRGDELVDFEGRRSSQRHYTPQHLAPGVTGHILDQLASDHADPEVEALILDELGPTMVATHHRHHRRGERLPQLVEQVLATPKPITVIVCPANVQWADGHDAQHALEVACASFTGAIHQYDIHPSTRPFVAASIMQMLETAEGQG